MRNFRLDDESGHQEALFEWAGYNAGRMPELEYLYHTPNGGKRDKATAMALKRQGVKAGVPDLCLPVPRNGRHGLYIELKAGKNKPTSKQKEWMEFLRRQGYHAAVCYRWEEAAELIEAYLLERPGNAGHDAEASGGSRITETGGKERHEGGKHADGRRRTGKMAGERASVGVPGHGKEDHPGKAGKNIPVPVYAPGI